MTNTKLSRRGFVAAGATAFGGATLASAVEASAIESPDSPLIAPGATVLFQGDSITDTRRNRQASGPNDHAGLGSGYAFLASTELLIRRPDDQLKLYNRGVSGNKVYQLQERWGPDCLDLKPDVVSILIGVNDIWHGLKGEYDGTVDTYRDDYHALAKRTREALPGVKLVVCEPFVLRVGSVTDEWFPEFDKYRAAAKEVADKHADAWVPFQSVLTAAARIAPAKTWAPDGVHPSIAGAAVMASAWLRAVGE